jgi:hypothetical protein
MVTCGGVVSYWPGDAVTTALLPALSTLMLWKL